MKITNISNGPRGFWHSGTLTVLAAGETIEREVDEVTFAGLKGNKENFKLDGAKAAESKAIKPKAPKPKRPDNEPAKSPAEVLAMADGNFMAFKAAATKVLGDDTPGTKDEIVKALEEAATKPE